MYGYSKYEPLDKESILLRVSEEDIFKIAFGENTEIVEGTKYTAPYRVDNVPDCYFERSEGTLYFVDFAAVGLKSLSCFGVLMKKFQTNFVGSLEIVNSHFSLGLGDNSKRVKKIVKNDYVEEENIKKSFKKRVITILPRVFRYKDKQFWEKYEITRENLEGDGVIPLELFQSTSKTGEAFSVRPLKVSYAYTEFPDGKKKIYTPYGNKLSKWFTNCNQNDVGSIKHLPKKGELLIITKSYKDCRVLRNQGLNAIWFQNEGMIPNQKILKKLCKRFTKIVVWFDNDRAGITNSRLLVQILNEIDLKKAKSVMLSPSLLSEGIKDPSDLIHKKGKSVLTTFLKDKKLTNLKN